MGAILSPKFSSSRRVTSIINDGTRAAALLNWMHCQYLATSMQADLDGGQAHGTAARVYENSKVGPQPSPYYQSVICCSVGNRYSSSFGKTPRRWHIPEKMGGCGYVCCNCILGHPHYSYLPGRLCDVDSSGLSGFLNLSKTLSIYS